MATSFQILPTANRPTAADALGNFIDTIQQRQAVAQKMQMMQQLQGQQQQQQAASDAQDRQNDLEDAAREQQDKIEQDQVDRFTGMEPDQQKALYQTLSPKVQQRLGYDPMALPAEAEDTSEYDKAQAAAIVKAQAAGHKIDYSKISPNVMKYLPPEGTIGEAPDEESETTTTETKTSTGGKQPKVPNFADPSQPDFKEHPAVKPINQKLRTLTDQGTKILNGGVTVTDAVTGKKRPLTEQEKEMAIHTINAQIMAHMDERSKAVNNLRSSGLKVAQGYDDKTYVNPTAQPSQAPAPQQPPSLPAPPPTPQAGGKTIGTVHLANGQNVRGWTDGKHVYDANNKLLQ